MTKEKQIEEMAFDIIKATCPLGVKDLTKQYYKTVATDLYELHGWRKASEVASEIFEEIEQEIKLALDSNYKARGKLLRKFPQEHNEIFMGSLNGKIDALRGIDDFIVELEKKYTEGER